MPELFDYTVLSTWDDAQNIPPGNFELLLNPKPPLAGVTNRNYQRYSVARGLDAAKLAGCDYVMKWRTDMLPTQMAIKRLLDWSSYSPPANAKSRIVLPAFRNLSVKPDTFSSIPDLFAFGHIDEMSKLWGDRNFDYNRNWNMPMDDAFALSESILNSPKLTEWYCAETELYAIYRSRIDPNLTHKTVAENYLRLINHIQLGILWFDGKSGFRSIGQAWEHPWWTEEQWKNKTAKVYPYGYQSSGLLSKFRKKLSKIKIQSELRMQDRIWNANFNNVHL